MDTREKLNLLGQAARYDDCTALGSDAVAEGRGLFAPEGASRGRAVTCSPASRI